TDHTRRENHPPRGEGLLHLTPPGMPAKYPVSLTVWRHMRDTRFGNNPDTQLFGQIQIVPVEAVLGAMGTAGNASTAQVAAAAQRALAVEKGINQTIRIAEVDSLWHRAEAVRRAHALRRLLQPVVLNIAI